jgi:hypothetical protein
MRTYKVNLNNGEWIRVNAMSMRVLDNGTLAAVLDASGDNFSFWAAGSWTEVNGEQSWIDEVVE